MQTTSIMEKICYLFCSYFPFEKQLLVCYWALTEIELLTTGHRVTMKSELPSHHELEWCVAIGQVSAIPVYYKVEMKDQDQSGLKGMKKLCWERQIYARLSTSTQL